VRQAREAVTGRFGEVGVAPSSAFADAVLLVVSVADADPHLPKLAPGATGAGPQLVAELAAEYDGDVSAEPTADHDGKVVLVRFRMPS
jgi:hypothetical protein